MQLIQKSSTTRKIIRDRLHKFALTQPSDKDIKVFCDNTSRGYDIDYNDIIKYYELIKSHI